MKTYGALDRARRTPAAHDHSARMEQQLELLQATVDDNARAIAEARACVGRSRLGDLGIAGELGTTQAESVAALRRARHDIRAHTEAVRSLVARLPRD